MKTITEALKEKAILKLKVFKLTEEVFLKLKTNIREIATQLEKDFSKEEEKVEVDKGKEAEGE